MAKKGGGGSKSYDYYGTIAAAVCVGPVDAIVSLIVDGKTVWPKADAWKAKTYPINSLVAHKGRIWKSTGSTSTEPGTSGAAWSQFYVTRGASNPYKFTVEGYGDAYFYWGTTDQTLDTVNEKTLSANGHPAYRRQAVLVLKNFLFGRERVSAPNVEVVIRRKPNQTLVSGASADLDDDGQANPVAVLAEILTDPTCGFGIAADRLDADAWQAAADALYAIRDRAYISPVWTSATSVRQIIPDLLEYFDGWMTRATLDGKIRVGLWPHNESPAAWTDATTIDYHDLTEPPEYKVQLWGEVSNEVTVRFSEASRAWKDGLERAASLLAVAVADGELRVEDIDRPFITRRKQANAIAHEVLKGLSRPGISGSLTVRWEKATAIEPGTRFLFTAADMGISEVCRCLGRTESQLPAGEVRIEFETDRFVSASAHEPEFTGNDDPAHPEPSRVLDWAFAPLTPEMAGDLPNRIALFAARGNSTTTEAGVWFRKSDGASWYEMARLPVFALAGTVDGNIDASAAPTVTVTVDILAGTPDADIERLTSSQSEDAVDDVALLMLVVRSGHPDQFEFFAVRSATANGGGSYDIEAERGAFNSLVGGDGSYVWTTGDRVFVIERAAIVPLYHQTFPTLAAEELSASFRIVPANRWEAGDVADVYDAGTNPDGLTVEADWDFIDPYAPSADWTGIRSGSAAVTVWSVATASRARASNVATVVTGSAHGLATGDLVDVAGLGGSGYGAFAVAVTVVDATTFTFASVDADETTTADTGGTVRRMLPTSKVVSLDLAMVDHNADLTYAQVFARRGEDVVVSASPASWNFSGVGSAAKTGSLTLTEGDWRVFAFLRDASGKTNHQELTPAGGGSAISLRVRTDGADAANPLADPIGDTYASSLYPLSVTLTCSTAGATIEYQVVTAGSPAGGSWTTYAGPVSVAKGKTLWARATHATLATSPLLKETYS